LNILITGCAGYLGSYFSDKLSLNNEYNVVGIDDFSVGKPASIAHLMDRKNFNFVRADITYLEREYLTEVKQADVIIHLAGYVGAPLCSLCPDRAKRVNSLAVRRLVDKLKPEQRLIFPNTNSGYGSNPGVCTEDTPLNPLSVYAESKLEGEMFVMEHPNVAVLRLATVFGVSPRMRFDLLVNDFTRRAYFEKQLDIFEGSARRNYVAINDVFRAFLWMFEPSRKGVFNVGDDKANCTKLELAQRVASVIPHNVAITNRDGEDQDKRDYEISSAKLYSTGFEIKTSLEVGIRDVIKYFSAFGDYQCKQMGNV